MQGVLSHEKALRLCAKSVARTCTAYRVCRYAQDRLADTNMTITWLTARLLDGGGGGGGGGLEKEEEEELHNLYKRTANGDGR